MLFPLFSLIFSFLMGFCSAGEPNVVKEGADKKMCDQFFIITGGPGAGKTTLIEELKRRGIFCIEEVARQIIQDEIASGGDALSWKNIESCIEKMLVRSIETYEEAQNEYRKTIIFDRGVLDYISYAYRTKTPISNDLHEKAKSLNYNKKVFIAPPWEEIYCNDSERKQTFDEALEVYATLFKIYSDYGYEILELPKTSVEERADFVINHIAN